MYKVFINDKPLFFTNTITEPNAAVIHFESEDSLLEAVKLLETDASYTQATVYHTDLEELEKRFESLYKKIDAAGGVVKNNKGQFLFIYRLDKWDLPKGKIESGEIPNEAAVREVQEECGLKEVRIIRQLDSTFHTYSLKGQRILKQTYWYEMLCNEIDLTAQAEEGITDVKWLERSQFNLVLQNTYRSIADVLKYF